jgi:hypothetical protein
MRTTVTLDDDVAAAVERLRRERHLGVSEALNQIARAGLVAPEPRKPFVQRMFDMGVGIDVTDIAEALDLLDGPARR